MWLPGVVALVLAGALDRSGPEGDGGVSAGAVLAYCQEFFPDSYTGLIGTEDPRSFVLYRVPTPGLDEALRACFPGGRFDIRDAHLTGRQLEAAAGRIVEDVETWRLV